MSDKNNLNKFAEKMGEPTFKFIKTIIKNADESSIDRSRALKMVADTLHNFEKIFDLQDIQ